MPSGPISIRLYLPCRALVYSSTKSINQIRNLPGVKLWQRNYYEHIIRTEESLEQLREYIMQNPQRWDVDQLHPNNPSKW